MQDGWTQIYIFNHYVFRYSELQTRLFKYNNLKTLANTKTNIIHQSNVSKI